MAIPRGGVEVGAQIAKFLDLEFSVVIVRKLPLPGNPEAGFGAVAEDGSEFIPPQAAGWVEDFVKEKIKKEQEKEIQRRIKVLRGGKPLPSIKNRDVILVDDGIAMGSTIRASIQLCKNKKVRKLIVASPVAGPAVAEQIKKEVDETVILEKPTFFRAVAQSYRNWYDVSDQEAIRIIDQFRNNSN